jgi:hypothetical protein
MKLKQAKNLLTDLRRSLQVRDFCEDIYLSVKRVGNRAFRSCAYFETEDWMFIWTLNDSIMFNKQDIGDFVLVNSKDTVLNLKKETTVYG